MKVGKRDQSWEEIHGSMAERGGCGRAAEP